MRLSIAKKALISAFIVFHVSAVVWWNIPENGFPVDVRAADLPKVLLGAEDAIFAWKKGVRRQGSRVVDALETYILKTATWQQWWMFAPNPLSFHRYLTVWAVIGKGPDGRSIYDPEPIWTSYRGTLQEELSRFMSAGGLLASYTHEHKFVENLSLGEFDACLDVFARWCGEDYARRKGKRPNAIHVVCAQYMLPPAFGGVAAKDMPVKEWVLWWVQY